MGLFTNLFEPKDYDGKVEKLFSYCKNNTKFVSMGLIRNSTQLKNAIIAISDVLGYSTSQLSYEDVKMYGDVFGTVLARAASASMLKSSGLIERTGEMLLGKYGFIRTQANANEIAKRLFALV